MLKIIENNAIHVVMKNQMLKEQPGFIKCHGTQYRTIRNLTALIETNYKFRKIFFKMGRPKYLIVIIRTFYEKDELKIRINNEIILKNFRTGREVRKGCILSHYCSSI